MVSYPNIFGISWKVGTKIISSGPCGSFYYEPLRDKKDIVAIGGGSGITPFRVNSKRNCPRKLDAK